MKFDTYDQFYQGHFTIQHFYVKSMKLYEFGSIKLSDNSLNKCVLFPINVNGEEKYNFRFENEISADLLKSDTTFDNGIAYNDRISFCTLPQQHNLNSMGLEVLKGFLGPTTSEKIFFHNEPYCMNVFTVRNNIMRISFGYGNPDRILEFDIDYDANRSLRFNKTEIIALLASQVLDRQLPIILMESIPDLIPKITGGSELSLDEVKSAVWTINQIYPKSIFVNNNGPNETTMTITTTKDKLASIAKELSL